MTTLLWLLMCLAIVGAVYWYGYTSGHEQGRIEGELAAKLECDSELVKLLSMARRVRAVSMPAEVRRD